jgi:alpha-glucosidase
LRELRAVVDEYPERVLVGETDDVAFYGHANDELHLVFNFPLMRTDRLSPSRVRANQRTRGAVMPAGAWPANTLGNHDESRVRTRFAAGDDDAARARLSAALVLTLPGTPFLYYGEEIGMTDLLLDEVALFRDHWGQRQYRESLDALALSETAAVAHGALHGRDKCRTPMQWANAANAGFSPAAATTWLPVHPNHAEGVNVADQRRDPSSLLSWYRRLIQLRRQTPALRTGACTLLNEDSDDCLAFLRRSDDAQTCLVVLNMSDRRQIVQLDASLGAARRLLSSTEGDQAVDSSGGLDIGPFEIYVAELPGAKADTPPILSRGPGPVQ